MSIKSFLNKQQGILVFVIVFLACISGKTTGLENKTFGVGIIIGEPTGLSFKTWVGEISAIDAALAWSLENKSRLYVQIGFLKHNFEKIKNLPFYYGVGTRLKIVQDDNSALGIRVAAGIEYIFDTEPMEVFFELCPVLDIIPQTDMEISGGIGLRYYFKL